MQEMTSFNLVAPTTFLHTYSAALNHYWIGLFYRGIKKVLDFKCMIPSFALIGMRVSDLCTKFKQVHLELSVLPLAVLDYTMLEV